MKDRKTFVIKNSKIEGKGFFALRDIKKGETIMHFEGEVVSEEEIDRRIDQGKERLDDPLQIGEEKFIDLDENSRLINHSCDPNAGIRGTNELFAIKDIKKGQEITFDYSTTVGKQTDHDWHVVCNCGSAQCRHIIKSFFDLPEEIRKKYYTLGCLPDFILEYYRTKK